MSEDKMYKPYNQLLKQIDKLKDPSFIKGREEFLIDLKDLLFDSYSVLGLSTSELDKTSDTRWIAIKIEDNKIIGGIFTDIKEIGRRIGTSDATIRRRLKNMNGTGRIRINGYTIQEMPYFKSKRGPNDNK
jgi:hypothetical protein